MSGPMLFSGTFELLLDSRILYYLKAAENNARISIHDRSRLLLIILISNLHLDPAWQHSIYLLATFLERERI